MLDSKDYGSLPLEDLDYGYVAETASYGRGQEIPLQGVQGADAEIAPPADFETFRTRPACATTGFRSCSALFVEPGLVCEAGPAVIASSRLVTQVTSLRPSSPARTWTVNSADASSRPSHCHR